MRYSEVVSRAQNQTLMLTYGLAGIGFLIPAISYGAWAIWRWRNATQTGRGLAKVGLSLTGLAERVERIFTKI